MSKRELKVPTVAEILKTGLQFGHGASRWNPKMNKYIFGEKNAIHVVDVVKTKDLLEEAINFLKEISAKEEVVFVGTKRQAASIVEELAIEVGAHFIVNRWPGGLFTNFKMVKQSLRKLKSLEQQFEEGVEGRTKYEVVQMKNIWGRLNRLYRGVKEMEKLPGAIVVIDPGYEKVAIREARLRNIPVIALTDTNCDPDVVDYIIPGNDDALKSITMITELLAAAVATGNGGKGVKHHIKDYNEEEVDIVKPLTEEEEDGEEVVIDPVEQPKVRVSSSKSTQKTGKGILEK